MYGTYAGIALFVSMCYYKIKGKSGLPRISNEILMGDKKHLLFDPGGCFSFYFIYIRL